MMLWSDHVCDIFVYR